ncbi:hypothetical protein UWK_03225 [Desulfocapsa sulfexigens DSM 10523]|uniref:Uncharacterized protein n=1 Tax=Desulfocapsa sulfexigens (strain DSM 10523 / SB164P1) TaxID=1167006 RepID=M1PDT5_DESSD|nr:hypothetical protein [Desulfocapsa sulfexigens]AGF79752.1 hypothetical protein UWK_03225 [Desulfocapsa sulfexigens DSM 10523]
MIQILVIFGAAIYLLLGLLVIVLVAKSTKGRIIGIIILALIPSWDVIIGYPTFWYFCKFKSGMKIYKTVENVEGFYVGELRIKRTPRMPNKNYKYIDYQVEETGEFFRSYWLNDASSEGCYKPKKKDEYKFKESFDQEIPCFAVKPLQPDEVSRYEVAYQPNKDQRILAIPTIDKFIYTEINDRHHNETLGIRVMYRWNRGWLRATLLNVDGSLGTLCPFKGNSEVLIYNTLKSKDN